MRRVMVINNPAAARSHPRALRVVTKTLESSGLEVVVEHTGQPGDAADLARRAVDQQFDALVVHGGDGTMIQAVQGMNGGTIPLGLVPAGTGNLLAGNLRISRNPRRAAEIITRGKSRKIDLGRLETEDGVRFFAVACGAGYDADLMANTHGPAKRRWGMGAYVGRVLSTLHEIAPTPYRLIVDGEPREIEAAMLLVANCSEIMPPVLALGSDIALDDGWLDLVAVKVRGPWQAVSVVWEMLRSKPDSPAITRVRCREVRIETTPPRPVQLDGEPAGMTPIEATLLPKALTVFIP
jgi:YegS/Rv2252/BmrU family lipid kinase